MNRIVARIVAGTALAVLLVNSASAALPVSGTISLNQADPAALTIPVSAAKPHPLDLSQVTGGGQMTHVIERQSWFLDCCTPDPSHTVVNPGGLGSWDINDHLAFIAGGSLAAGASTSGNWRHIWAWNPIFSCRPMCANWSGVSNWYGADIIAPSPNLTASVCFAPQDRCFIVAPVWSAEWNAYAYLFCAQVVYVPEDPALVDIADSGGGRGVPSTMTLSVANPTNRTVRNVTAGYGTSSDVTFTSGCSLSNPNQSPRTFTYPFAVVDG